MASWARPTLPERYKIKIIQPGGWLVFAGVALFLVGSIIMSNSVEHAERDLRLARLGISSYSDSPDTGFASFLIFVGSASTGIGTLMVVVGSVLQEIRQLAFEAALRAGETKVILAAPAATPPVS